MDEDLLRTIDEGARAAFEAAWREGQSIPDLADYLPEPEAAFFLATLEELVHIDLEFRYKSWVAHTSTTGADSTRLEGSSASKKPSLERYLNDYPQLIANGAEPRLRETLEQLQDDVSLPSEQPDSNAAETPAATLGRYELLEVAGQGGFGVVWRARDRRLGRIVAIKQLDDRHARNTEIRKRFYREGQITARLQHPGIVPLHEMSQERDVEAFYSMKLVDGETLAEAIERHHHNDDGGSLDAVEGLRLLRAFLSVCQAMQYAHSVGVIHRDLKPQNVVVGEFGETMVLDWGLAKPLDEVVSDTERDSEGVSFGDDALLRTRMGAIQGTPAFMSPEQARGEVQTLGPASDVFSLGCVLFQLLTGKMPFEGDSSEQVIRAVRGHRQRSPRTTNSSVPRPLDAICRKAMAPQPSDRYADAGLLARDLERYFADEPVKAWREPLSWRAQRWARRHRMWVASAGLAILSAAVIIGVVWDAAARRQRQAAAHSTQLEEQERQRIEALKIEAEATRKLAENELSQGRFASALRLLSKSASTYATVPALAGSGTETSAQRERISRIVDFYRHCDTAEQLVYFERIDEARALLQLGLNRLGVFENVEWWNALPAADLTPGQLDQLRNDAYRELHLLYALRIFEAVEGWFQRREATESAFLLGQMIQRFRPSFSADCGQKLLGDRLSREAVSTLPPDYPRTAADNLCLGSIMWSTAPGGNTLQALLIRRYTGLENPAESARGMLQRAAELDPGHYWTQVFLARSHALYGKHQAARTACERCVALRPDFYFSYVFRSSILMIQANSLVQRDPAARDGDEVQQLLAFALRDLDVARDLDNNSPEVYRRLANVLAYLPETTPEAVANCIRSIKLAAPAAEIDEPHQRRVRDRHNGDYAVFAKRLQDQAGPRIAAFQAWNAWANQDYDATLRYSAALREVEPDSAEADLLTGLAELGKENFDTAKKAFVNSLAIEPASYWALDGLARCELAAGRNSAAASAFRRAAVAAENLALKRRSLEGLLKAHLAAKAFPEAESVLTQIRDLNPAAFPRWLAGAKAIESVTPLHNIVTEWRKAVQPVLPTFAAPPEFAPLLNGGFELGLAAHWGSAPTKRPRSIWWNRGGARSAAIADESLSRTHRFSLRIRHETTTDNPAEEFAATAQLIPVAPNHEYRLSGWARGQDAVSGAVLVTLSDGWQTTAARLPAGDFDWTQFTCRLVSRSPWLTVQIRSQGPAEVWLDDLQLQRTSDRATDQNAP